MSLLKDQIESLRYANHLWPLLVLRLYTSYYFWESALLKQGQDYLSQPILAAAIDEYLIDYQSPEWVVSLYTGFFQSQWQWGASLFYYSEWLLGLLFLIGFLNRPAAFFGICYLLFASFITPPEVRAVSFVMVFILLTLLFFGSGRVGGIDYYFYKRQRGLLW